MNFKKIVITLLHAFAGWGLCGAAMGLGLAFTTLQNALLIHLLAAPVIFGLVSLLYFKKFNFTSPAHTALIFVGSVITLDFFIVALLINKSMEMFTVPLGTWIPFLLLSLATYFSGLKVTRENR